MWSSNPCSTPPSGQTMIGTAVPYLRASSMGGLAQLGTALFVLDALAVPFLEQLDTGSAAANGIDDWKVAGHRGRSSGSPATWRLESPPTVREPRGPSPPGTTDAAAAACRCHSRPTSVDEIIHVITFSCTCPLARSTSS